MITIQNTIAIILLFWPIVFFITILAFIGITVLVFFIGGTISISSIFFYGIYAILRDTGYLTYMYNNYSNVKNHITKHVSENIKKSFLLNNVENLIKTQPVLYICHPHGLYGMSWFIHFASCITEWSDEIKRPRLAIHSIFFKIPFIREFMKSHRCIPATEHDICQAIKEGDSVAIILGGIEELNYNKQGIIQLIIKKRKGYIRIAKALSIPIIPLITIGENELFPCIDSPLWKIVQDFLYKKFHISFPLPSLQSLFSWINLANLPLELEPKLKTYILNPVITDNKSDKSIRQEYINRIEEFSKQHGDIIEIIG